MTEPVISAHDLSRRLGATFALDGVTFDAEPGEVVALLGPNGAGKTTTVRLLNGLLRPDRGHSRVLGLDPIADGGALRRRTGVLTENAGLDDRLSALENLVFTARIRGIDRRDATRRAGALLEQFGLADRIDTPVQGASTGQRRRMALARALLHDPEVLFLDEPTSGLDPAATRDVLDLIGSLTRDQGRTVILCTHFLAEANRLASRVALLQHGRLTAFGRPDDLARTLWPALAVELDLGSQASPATLDLLLACRGVVGAEASADGARVQVETRAVVPALVDTLVAREVPVFAAIPHRPSLEDIYFALQDNDPR